MQKQDILTNKLTDLKSPSWMLLAMHRVRLDTKPQIMSDRQKATNSNL